MGPAHDVSYISLQYFRIGMRCQASLEEEVVMLAIGHLFGSLAQRRYKTLYHTIVVRYTSLQLLHASDSSFIDIADYIHHSYSVETRHLFKVDKAAVVPIRVSTSEVRQRLSLRCCNVL